MNSQQTDINLNLKFVKAQETDVDLLFRWINDTEVRAQSLTTQVIDYNDHTKWLSGKLADNNCYLYIIYESNKPAGMIRFDIHGNECTLSYLVDKMQRGKGIGTLIVNKGLEQFKIDSGFTGKIEAIVKSVNNASLKIFYKAKFKKQKEVAGLVYFNKLINNERN